MSVAPGRWGGGQGGDGGVEILLDAVEAACDQLQLVPAALGVSVREAAEAMSRVLDETADGGQRPGVLVGELPQQPGELRGGVSHVGPRGGAPGEPGGRIQGQGLRSGAR